jgi:hypothetical protein
VASQRQVSNLQAGDIVIFIGTPNTVEPDVMGFVTTAHASWPDDEQGVLIQFFGKHDLDPLHYYHRELDDFLESGEIRIQSAS